VLIGDVGGTQSIVALVVGATGIAGRGACQELIRCGAEVHDFSRNRRASPGVCHVADLLIAESLEKALEALKATQVYTTTWSRRHRGEEHRGQRGVVRDLLAALLSASSVKHLAGVTGLKHCLGPFDADVRT
jgi:uncharacterized protein YbjT (DUF2867 family)